MDIRLAGPARPHSHHDAPELRRLDVATVAPDSQLLSAIIDQLGMGVLVTTFDGLLIHANPAAYAALRAFGLDIGDDGRLSPGRASDAAALQKALAAAAHSRRSLVVIGARQPPMLTIAVQPLLVPSDAQRVSRAMLVFGVAAGLNATSVDAFKHAYQLTPAESAVVSGLCEGLQAKEVAQRGRSSVATVRSHLRSIYYKTGSRNLQDLLARVAALPPMGVHG